MKSPWEYRVGLLLKRDYPYVFKPSDFAGAHGGASKLDWLFCTTAGHFGAVEVKLSSLGRSSFRVEDPRFMSPLQAAALSDICLATHSIAWLAVGSNDTLFWYDWRTLEPINGRVQHIAARAVMTWHGEQTWLKNEHLPWRAQEIGT